MAGRGSFWARVRQFLCCTSNTAVNSAVTVQRIPLSGQTRSSVPAHTSQPHVPSQQELEQWIINCLLELPSALSGDFVLRSLQTLAELVDEDPSQYTNVLQSACRCLHPEHPLSAFVLDLLFDAFPKPAFSSLPQFSTFLCNYLKPPIDVNQATLAMCYLQSIAITMAGVAMEKLCTHDLLSALENILDIDEPQLLLAVLIAIEHCAMTRQVKAKLMQRNIMDKLARLESRFCKLAQDGQHQQPSLGVCDVLESTSRTRYKRELLHVQIGFQAMYILDNVLPLEGRTFTVDRPLVKNLNVSVILDPQDATKNLKLAPDGLEARCDDPSNFESVKATCCATKGDVWFYEATIFTNGISQIGWATQSCEYLSEEGRGIGDDEHSFAIDGCRKLFWFNGHCKKVHMSQWQAGDVVGCALDLNNFRATFYTNGKYTYDIRLPCQERDAFYPAVSLMTRQHLQLNFGNQPYRFPPRIQFRDLQAIGSLTDEQRQIVPRLVQLARLQQEQNADEEDGDDDARCAICFNIEPKVQHIPCKHADFCRACSERCTECPFCRSPIVDRKDMLS
eukprot:m.350287 g.350287  ORF g.350287 m.350287 type:complete len:563 (+) comp16158_c0_seq2:105-1793(+)